ncbi:MAG: hypothetical protein KJ826_00960, partial [Proteobacteria bacterium]|nr:hypothetical protein [Pseudomonadota bacterium]
PLSKRFSLVKVKAGENFNRRNTWSISRIKIFAQRRDRPKWDVLKLAPAFISHIGCRNQGSWTSNEKDLFLFLAP